MRRRALQRLARDEAGHAAPAASSLGATIGAILLAAGAASGEDVITIIGGVALGLGILLGEVLGHMQVDYDIFSRLNRLEGKDSEGGD